MTELTHFNADGNAHMVDVGNKEISKRVAIASGQIHMQAATLSKILEGSHKKGDVLGIARIAGIMGSKKTSELVPLCHPIGLTHVDVDFEIQQDKSLVICTARAETNSQTGVEMEAMFAVQVALLTIYDMCKAMDRGMSMHNIELLEKSGGKSGHWLKNTTPGI